MSGNFNEYGIDFDLITIDSLFSARRFYRVPHYQRGYSWGNDEISALLDDVDDAKRDFPNEAYLLGQIIVCPTSERDQNANLTSKTGQFDIIDGQQRLTTLFLIISTALTRIDELQKAEQDPEKLELKYEFNEGQKARIGEWRNFLKIWGKDDKVSPKVKPAQDGEAVLLQLLNAQIEGSEDGLSPTQINLNSGVQTVREWLQAKGLEEVYNYLEFMMDSVHLVQITLRTSAQALRVFQKVNNRGLELDDADLIKSFLFQHVASDNDFERFAAAWDSSAKVLLNATRKPLKNMETFMKLLIGIRTGQYVSKGNLYERWEQELAIDRSLDLDVEKQKKLSNAEKDRIRAREVPKLVGNLQTQAKSLVHISKSEVPIDGSKTDLAYGVVTTGFIQPYEVLLAGAHLSKKSYSELLKIVEDRAMLSSWSGEPKNLVEPIIHPWAHKVSALDPHASREEILDASSGALEKLHELLEGALIGIKRLNYDVAAQRPRLRYVLARAHLATQRKFNVSVPSIRELMKTTNPNSGEKGYDLDHVFPKSQSKVAAWTVSASNDEKFGSEDRYQEKVHSLGNLVLLHPDDNRDQSDELPWSEEKLTNLAQSELYLNRFLVPHAALTGSPKVAEAAKQAQADGCPTISQDTWGEDEVDKLVEYYWKLVSADVRETLGH